MAVNCAAIPEQFLESELFGYVPGTFTGAHRDGKTGLSELAHKGTLSLDEIGEISLPLQAKLLRVLQEREITRVGGDSVIPVDIRILAATNQNLEQLAAERQFREDLLYRLDVLRIDTPSLNRRREDISLLADSYMKRAFPDIRITGEAKAYLEQMGQPGSVRQLFNFCERLVVFCNGFAVDADLVAAVSLQGGIPPGTGSVLPDEEDEQCIITKTLASRHYHKGNTAKALGISRSTLQHKLREYGIRM